MSKGYNSEADPRRMPEGNFPEFQQLTLEGSVVRPRPADASYTPTVSTLDAWRLGKLGVNSRAAVYSIDLGRSLEVYTPKAGGTPKAYDFTEDAEENLIMPTPAAEPTMTGVELVVRAGALVGSVAAGTAGAYAMAWVSDLDGAISGLSPVNDVILDDYTLLMTAAPYALLDPQPEAPAAGSTITNSTLTETAEVVAAVALPVVDETDFYRFAILIEKSSKSAADAWVATNEVTWTLAPPSSTLKVDEAASSAVTPTFTNPNTPPAGIDTWALYHLEDSTGFWRKVGTAAHNASISDSGYFPYGDIGNTILFPAWPGPLDNNSLPETLAGTITAAQIVAVHKGCLFVGVGSTLLYSEPEQPRYFRAWASLAAGGEVIGLVSRNETLEVYTPTKVNYIIGNAPYFELRETGITEGPIAKESIVGTDKGTFALFDDGIYLCNSSGRQNLTQGVHGPFLAAMTTPATAVGGASKGIYYLVDAAGRCLAYDWERDEWFYRTFTTQPSGFYFAEEARNLIAKYASTYGKVGSAPAVAVAWVVTLPDQSSGGRFVPTPAMCFADIDGTMLMDYKVNGTSKRVYSLTETREIRLPIGRGRYYTARLTGTGTRANTEIRSVEFRG